jgi:hypothetical protein
MGKSKTTTAEKKKIAKHRRAFYVGNFPATQTEISRFSEIFSANQIVNRKIALCLK